MIKLKANKQHLSGELISDIIQACISKGIITEEVYAERFEKLLKISRKSSRFGKLIGAIQAESKGRQLQELVYSTNLGPLYLFPYLTFFEKEWISLIEKIQQQSLERVLISGTISTSYKDISNRAFILLKLPISKSQTVLWYGEYGAMGAASISRFSLNSSNSEFTQLSKSTDSEELKASSKDKAISAMNQIARIQNEQNKHQKSSQEANKAIFEIGLLQSTNLGHQFWNQYCVGYRISSFLNSFHPEKEFIFNYDNSTNYFPAQSLAEHFSTKARTNKADIYISPGQLIYTDALHCAPLYKQTRGALTKYLERNAIFTGIGSQQKNSKRKVIIFAHKAGRNDFSATQFDIKEAIEITVQSIKQLNQESADNYHFIIDGITTPYVPEGQQAQEEPEQRRRFRKSEEYWFGKLKQELAGIELTFINGKNLIEKYPYYKAASKFIKFGCGSYGSVWNAINNPSPSNHLTVFYSELDLRKSNESPTSKLYKSVLFDSRLTEEIVYFIQGKTQEYIKRRFE